MIETLIILFRFLHSYLLQGSLIFCTLTYVYERKGVKK